jgi:hypothetical protein
MKTTWTVEDGRLWATCADGRRFATWEDDPYFPCLPQLAAMLNVSPDLGDLLLGSLLNPPE